MVTACGARSADNPGSVFCANVAPQNRLSSINKHPSHTRAPKRFILILISISNRVYKAEVFSVDLRILRHSSQQAPNRRVIQHPLRSWDQAFNSMATSLSDSRLALDQFLLPFDV